MSKLLYIVILLLLLFICELAMIYIWDNSILPAINQYYHDSHVDRCCRC